jgi:hypothetical protein
VHTLKAFCKELKKGVVNVVILLDIRKIENPEENSEAEKTIKLGKRKKFIVNKEESKNISEFYED